MRNRFTVLLICILASNLLVSSGYGKWQEEVTVVGDITVVPDPDVLADMEADLSALEQELSDEIERQRIAEEERKKAEQLALLEAQKKLGEQKLQEQQTNEVEVNSGEDVPSVELGDSVGNAETPIEDVVEKSEIEHETSDEENEESDAPTEVQTDESNE